MQDTTFSLHFEIFAGYNQAKIPPNSPQPYKTILWELVR